MAPEKWPGEARRNRDPEIRGRLLSCAAAVMLAEMHLQLETGQAVEWLIVQPGRFLFAPRHIPARQSGIFTILVCGRDFPVPATAVASTAAPPGARRIISLVYRFCARKMRTFKDGGGHMSITNMNVLLFSTLYFRCVHPSTPSAQCGPPYHPASPLSC